jgi:isoleucyl-tRNA synthetase
MKKVEQANFPQFEQEMLKVWHEEKTFEKSLELRKGAKRFSFYDGPPFANGLPHYGHVVAITEKDSITRYKTMKGYYVPRRNGWDTHGLPVEYEVEKQLGISGKKQIQDMGVAKFNSAARASVFKYKEQWEEFMTRIGRWADKDSYATLDDDYIESVWWVHGQLYDKGLVYRGFRSNPYCPRCATPLSNFEVNQNYKDNVPDPSVYVKFPLVENANTSLLAWTTTPWSLPANAALAVGDEAIYVTVEMLDDGDAWVKGEKLILAKERLAVLDVHQAEFRIEAEIAGRELVGLSYEPLYGSELADSGSVGNAWKVYADSSVSLEDGTGVLHVAPRYGETDLAMGQKFGLPLIESVDGNGQISKDMASQTGLKEHIGVFFKDADRLIIEGLTRRGRIWAAETFEHTYPFCWRCESPLLYFAMPSWFVKVASLRDDLVVNNEKISWVPKHIKTGRFGNWLAEARDWNFSRNRFWGAPIPIWVNEVDENDLIIVKSIEELKKLSGVHDIDLHRPHIDEIVIKQQGKTYRRVEEVFDCWFESGSMPYAQDHYPFEHEEEFEDKFPAEFIAEGLDQTRGWFYTLHVLGTALFNKPAFKNVIVHGMVLAADGKKLSKRLRNYPEPSEIFDGTGADSLRFFLMASPVENGEDVRFSYEAVNEVTRNVFMTLWNVVSFFTLYAEIDKWKPNTKFVRPQPNHVLDQWMLARLDEAITDITKAADSYQIARAVDPLKGLIDDLSNWYVRRSRRRFGKSQSEADKLAAYQTLHYTLLIISQLLAPWSPFLSDKIWRILTEKMDVPSSVHLSDWPKIEQVDGWLLAQMKDVREIVTDGLALRAAAGIKVRQPLAEARYNGGELSDEILEIAAEELNVKRLINDPTSSQVLNAMVREFDEATGNDNSASITAVGDKSTVQSLPIRSAGGRVVLNTEITQELKLEGLARDLIRQIQDKRKSAELRVDDKIKLVLGVGGDIEEATKTHFELIKQEVLAIEFKIVELQIGVVPIKVSGQDVSVEIEKA